MGRYLQPLPATCTDTFGSKFAAANAGLLYTAKGTAALLVPFSSLLTEATGSWRLVFWIAAAMNIATAMLAIFALRPLRRRMISWVKLPDAVVPVPQRRGGTLTPIIASRVTNFASRSSSHSSVPAGRRGNTR